ncbi:MAG: agmatinase [Lachnospiraceae bacterium]|nr:agmatinase [Lachnospiraceae bacterium]
MFQVQDWTFLECDKKWEDAEVILYGAPFDGTTSYRPGARFGSQAIRNESYGIESYSPYQDRDLMDMLVRDIGDLSLPFGETKPVLATIKDYVKEIVDSGKIPFMLGGEHLVSLAAFQEVHRAYPDVAVIHLDAHADLRDHYMGVKLSHACVMRRCWELVGDGNIYQFGIRSGEREEFAWAAEGHVFMNRFNFNHLDEVLRKLSNRPVYLTVDLDVLDPSIFPGTGTPEPNGVSFDELRTVVTKVCSAMQIVGCDVNELSPPYDSTGASTIVACTIVREMLLAMKQADKWV